MKDPMTSQAASPLDPSNVTLASLEMTLLERDREIELLRREIERYKRQGEEAQGRAAMLQTALDRHFAHCGRDDGAIQRLMAGLAEATARRKEQVAIIERRDRRIIALQEELDQLNRGGARGPAAIRGIWNVRILASRLRKVFSPRRV